MPELVSLVQDKEVRYAVRQGVKFEIELQWLEEDETPKDISTATFLAQIRDNFNQDGGEVVVNFTTTPGPNGDVLVINLPEARTTFKVSDETALAMMAGTTYYFEVKMIQGDGPVDSFQASITPRKDVARAV